MTNGKPNLKFNLLTTGSIAVTALMTAHQGAAFAQEQAQEQESAIEQIMVTATKRLTSIQEVPLAITALSGDFTREVNINDMKDLITWTPGITGNTQDSFIDAVSVRGILTNDFGVGGDPSIGFFKNNLYQGRNGVVVTSLYDMERAEALRGPQGFLFGRSAIGGAISVFTQKPNLNSNDGYAELDVGERGHVVAEGAINFSNSDTFGVRIAGYYSTENGYVDNIARPDDKRLLGHEKYAIRGSARYEVENFSAVLTLEYEDRDQDGTVYRAVRGSSTFQRLNDLFGIPLRGNARDVDQDLGFDGITDDSEIFSAGLQMEWDLGSVTLSSNTGFTDHEYRYIEDFDGTNLQLNDYLQDQEGDYFQQELRLTSDNDDSLSWYAGASYYKENVDATFTSKGNEGALCSYYFAPYYEDYYDTLREAGNAALSACQYYYYDNEPYDNALDGELIERNRAVGKYKGWAGYINVNYEITDKIDVGVGVRYAKDTKNFSLEAFPVESALGPFFNLGITTAEPIVGKQSWDAFTPQFIVRYRPTRNFTWFASVTRGFKSGGFGSFSVQERPGEPELPFGALDLTNADAILDDFDPEQAWSYETGIKGTTAQGRIRYDANAFYYTYKDLQLFVVGEGGGTRVDNVGRAKGYGLEGSLQWAINDNFDFRLAAAHTSSELREAQAICPGDDENACEGIGFSHVPDLSGSARLSYTQPVNGGRLKAAAELFGQTKTSALSASTDPAEQIDAYADITLRLGYQSDNGWGVTGYVENVTNALYYDGIFAGDGVLPGVFFNPSRPRTFGIRFSTEFGG